MTTENLACPFCGATEDGDNGVTYKYLYASYSYMARYRCSECGASMRGPSAPTPEEAVALAVKAWNTRNPPAVAK